MVIRIHGLFAKNKHYVCGIQHLWPVKSKLMDKQKQKEEKAEDKKAAFRRVEKHLKEQGIDAVEFQRKIGIDSQNWNNWKNRGLPTAEMPRVAEAAGLRLEYVITGKGDRSIGVNTDTIAAQNKGIGNVEDFEHNKGKVPLISWVQAGQWGEAHDPFPPGYAEDWPICPVKHGSRTYALRVKGDSMTSPYPGVINSYPEGFIIHVDPDVEAVSGKRVIARLPNTNEATFKEYQVVDGRHWLNAINPKYAPIEIDENTHICGVVIYAGRPD